MNDEVVKFPERLFVTQREDDEEGFFICSEAFDTLVESGEKIPMAVYQLVETGICEASPAYTPDHASQPS